MRKKTPNKQKKKRNKKIPKQNNDNDCSSKATESKVMRGKTEVKATNW